MPSRVSSASSVRSDAQPELRIGFGRRLADRLFVGGVEPAAVGDRRGEHALELRRGAHHQLLRLAQPGRFSDLRDRGIELLVGVGAVRHAV